MAWTMVSCAERARRSTVRVPPHGPDRLGGDDERNEFEPLEREVTSYPTLKLDVQFHVQERSVSTTVSVVDETGTKRIALRAPGRRRRSGGQPADGPTRITLRRTNRRYGTMSARPDTPLSIPLRTTLHVLLSSTRTGVITSTTVGNAGCGQSPVSRCCARLEAALDRQ